MNRPINVIHICDKFGVAGSSIHGVSRLFSWWIPRFNKDRYQVKLVGLRKGDPAVETLVKQGVDVICLNKGKFDISTLFDIITLIKKEKPDILHLHGYGATNFGLLAAHFYEVKCVVHEHFVDPAMPAYQKLADYLLTRFADYGIAVSSSVKEFMIEQRSMREGDVEVVFNGAPLNEFSPVSSDEIAVQRSKWNIPDGCMVAATIGRLDEQKGNKYFVEAARIILRKRQDIRFMIVGDGPYYEQLKALCTEYEINEDVIFTGYCADVPSLQSMVDIQVFPSLWEGTPLTLFEAMAMQRPIVSTTVDGLGEVLHDRKNAMLMQPRDANALAESIEYLLDRPEEAARLAKQAREDSKTYDIQATVERLQDIYEELLV